MARNLTVVFGGATGMIGSEFCLQGYNRGKKVVALSRSASKALPNIFPLIGKPSENGGEIIQQQADALNAQSYSDLLARAETVVVAVGVPPLPNTLLGGKEAAVRNGGLSNLTPIMAAKEAKVPNVILVNATMPAWLSHAGMSGYVTGKVVAEKGAEAFSEGAAGTAIVAKPSFVYGTRYVGEGHIPIPLWMVGMPLSLAVNLFKGPLDWLASKVPFVFKGLVDVPPVSASEVANAAFTAIDDPANKGKLTVLDPHDIKKKAAGKGLAALLAK